MEKSLKLNNENLHEFALRCYDTLQTAESKGDGLKLISDLISTQIGDYFGPEILTHHDEFSLSFIGILDQIVFEMEENTPSDEAIRDYIIDDLYIRLRKYLDILYDKDVYKHNFTNGLISQEDTIIIKHFQMEEYIPELITEFYDQTSITKTNIKGIPFI